MPRSHRRPSHAGSWYEDKQSVIEAEIDGWLAEAQPSLEAGQRVRAIIAPHAGYRYCGHVMANAYKLIDPSRVRRVLLLGPSHHFYSQRCSLSPATSYDTPFGAAPIDADAYAALRATDKFDTMSSAADEAEHSLELHMPYLMHVMKGKQFTLVPIVVGALSAEREAEYGRLLAPYLDDPGTLIIVSSDFCHWGVRFSYTYYKEACGPIWKSIEWLDRLGMDTIETGSAADFRSYLRRYGNTICGRHPIGVLLSALEHVSTKLRIVFNAYDQSHKATGPADSSVSYATAVVTAADA